MIKKYLPPILVVGLLLLIILGPLCAPTPPIEKFQVTFKQGPQFIACGRGVVHGNCIHFSNGSGGCGEFIVERIGVCE